MTGKTDLVMLDEQLRALRAEAKALGIARAAQDRIDALAFVIARVHTAREANDARQKAADS